MYGAIVALAIAYGLFFFLLRVGIANITSPGAAMDYGRPAFARAGLNLCASQHAQLLGSGKVSGAVEAAKAKAKVVLPLNVWAIIPVAALFVSGYAAGKLRSGAGRYGIIIPALLGAIIYAGVLAALSRFFAAPIESAALPSAGGVEFAPPDFPFHPKSSSAFYTAVSWGIIFTYIGSHFAAGEAARREGVNRWWICGKSIIPFAIVLQLLFAIASQAWLISKTGPENPEGPAGRGIVKFQPTIAGIAYGLVNGAGLNAELVSETSFGSGEKKPFAADVNLYKGVTTYNRGQKTTKSLPNLVYIGAGIIALLALASGALAVRWGSRDGSLPTAFRIGAIHALYLWIIMFLCSLSWQSIITAGSIKASSGVSIELIYEPTMLVSFFGVFIMAFIGAYITSRLYASGRRGFPSI
jgi:hypothetical protein